MKLEKLTLTDAIAGVYAVEIAAWTISLFQYADTPQMLRNAALAIPAGVGYGYVMKQLDALMERGADRFVNRFLKTPETNLQ